MGEADAESWRRLAEAIAGNDAFAVRRLLEGCSAQERSALLEATDERGRSALHLAVAGSSFEVAEVLLHAGASTGRSCDQLGTPLHAAVLVGDLDMLRLLLRFGASPNSLYSARALPTQPATPLTAALVTRNGPAFALLLAYGADGDLAQGRPGQRTTLSPEMKRQLSHGQARLQLLGFLAPNATQEEREAIDAGSMAIVSACLAAKRAGELPPVAEAEAMLGRADCARLVATIGVTRPLNDVYLAMVYE